VNHPIGFGSEHHISERQTPNGLLMLQVPIHRYQRIKPSGGPAQEFSIANAGP
jgi:hypothetical protein